MTAKTPAQRKADERARNKEAGLSEVRGIIAPDQHHAEVKEKAKAWITAQARREMRKGK